MNETAPGAASDYRVPFDELPWEQCADEEQCADGIRHKLRRRGSQLLRLVEYSRSMPPHWCARGHIGMIVQGRFEIEFDSGTHLFTTGEGVDIPAGPEHRHRARALSDTVVALFIEVAD